MCIIIRLVLCASSSSLDFSPRGTHLQKEKEVITNSRAVWTLQVEQDCGFSLLRMMEKKNKVAVSHPRLLTLVSPSYCQHNIAGFAAQSHLAWDEMYLNLPYLYYLIKILKNSFTKQLIENQPQNSNWAQELSTSHYTPNVIMGKLEFHKKKVLYTDSGDVTQWTGVGKTTGAGRLRKRQRSW